MSEDCLHLNVFVPLDVDLSVPLQDPLPVMVWIHGGDFIAGSASKPLYDGRFISNFTHTIVVSVEYRLGEKARKHALVDEMMRNGHLLLLLLLWFLLSAALASGSE